MELIRGLHNIQEAHNGCVLTIGKFDGVHLGHQAVLKNLLLKAHQLSLPAVVMVFEPQPEELFAPDYAPARLSLLRDKFIYMKEIGIHRLLCVRFTHDFASMSPTAFIQELLVEKLGVKFLVVGDDFRFGHKREGDFDMLRHMSHSAGYEVVSTQSFRMNDCRISSTAVRSALALSEFDKAQTMLGKPYVVRGKVVHGEKNGRTIGFPTANVLMHRHKAPIKGVFAVKASIDGTHYFGVANLGIRPTLSGKNLQLETHLFQFNGDLYGETIEVEFLHKIRDEIKFKNFNELKEQIQQDAEQARRLLSIN